MNTPYHGLTDQQVNESRQQHGSNLLTPAKKESLWKLFFEKFNDPIIRILLVAAVLSLIVSIIHNEYAETIGIFCAIFLATGVAFWFEVDANKKFELLNQVNDDTPVKVIRNGNFHEVPKKDIVVGDIVLLETGDEIPADGELLQAVSLQVNESTLTGEPVVSKTTNEAYFFKDATYPSDQIYRGTTITDGHCTMEVLAVGDHTEFGKVAQEATIQSGEETPLNRQLNRLAKVISVIGFTVGILTFVLLAGFFLIDHWNEPGFTLWSLDTAGILLSYFMVAVTLIVVCVPEGLPMSVTLSLALSMRRMLKTNNLVRKMHACETMGAVTVICTDKTGTLTQNRMQVHEANFYALTDQKPTNDRVSCLIQEGIAVNSTAFLDFTDPEQIKALGNPTEAALLFWLNSYAIPYVELRENATIVEQLTFSTERKYMATLIDSPLVGKRILYVKGAPEIVFALCKQVETTTGLVPAADYQQQVEQQLLDYQSKAMRTLAFAYREVAAGDDRLLADLMKDGLTFLGITAISDPVRPDVPAAVAECMNAGIGVKIITGDTPGTAREIGKQIGIWTDEDSDQNIIIGSDFAALTDEEALKRVSKIKIMCRARPMDKQRMVQLLQKTGEIVAVTGDGTNDAPALNFANVGLSMGSGTSVAKEASDITLLDDSFKSIATAVMWGRSLYKNIQRFMIFQLTINVTALIIVLLGSILGTELPLTVTQMLWVNLIMDTFAACALASLPANPDVMKEQPRRRKAFIITPLMASNILITGAVFVTVLLWLLYRFTDASGFISVYELSYFFTFFVLLQFWNIFNAKAFDTGHSTFRKCREAGAFLGIAALILIGQFIIVTWGGEVFRTEPLAWKDWGIILLLTSSVLWVGELSRIIPWRKKSVKGSK